MSKTHLRFAALLATAFALTFAFGLTTTDAFDNCEDQKATEAEKEEGFVTILGKGHTEGWAINDEWMKIDEDGVLIAGTMDKKIPKTMYAAHSKVYRNFELRAQAKAEGPKNTNGGFQIRSAYNKENGQMAGYQADMGAQYWGRLYDQSRGRGLLGKHEEGVDLEKDINWGGWNDYVVRCEGPRIRIWINGKLFTDYTEKNEKFINDKGVIGLQLHGGPASVRYYRNIRVKELD